MMQVPAVSILGRTYTLRPSRADHRLLMSPFHEMGSILPTVDHRPLMRPVRDQGQKGFCFAFATAALKEFNCAVWGGSKAPLGAYLSPDYIGWRTETAEGTFGQDQGASLADAMAVLGSWGVCPEDFLAYDAHNKAHAGNAACDVAARPYRVATPARVAANPDAFKAVLSASKVIALGFEVLQSFEETGHTGVVPTPKGGSLGGHAVTCVGYDSRGFVWRNSWSSSWGDGGYCYVPDAYLDLVFEAWTTA